MYIKIVLYQNYPNSLNIFNQVGIIALAFYGDLLTENTLKKLIPTKTKSNLKSYLNFDPLIKDKIFLLEKEKRHAAKKENFPKAKRIKKIIEQLSYLGNQILTLEKRKMIAIKKDDFDSASIISSEIYRLKAMADSNNFQKREKTPVQRKIRPKEQYKKFKEDTAHSFGENDFGD